MSPNDTAKRKENASALIIKCMISPPSSQANNVAVDLGFLAETESSSAEISPPVRGRTSSARQRQYPATSAGKGKLRQVISDLHHYPAPSLATIVRQQRRR